MTPTDFREARHKLGLSVKDMAALLDTDPLSIRRIEMGEDRSSSRRPAPRMARLVRAYLDGWRPEDWPAK